jgi:two-component system response regulator PilR (NtrC family)
MDERARILVVDDDESIRKAISTILEEKGYEVDTAESGREAIKKTHDGFYNLALIDIRLPDMEGTELLLRMKETTPRIVKIVVTGFPSLQNAMDAVNRNADAYVIKPVHIDDLLETIRMHLEKQRQAKLYSEEKIAEFIETRVKELDLEAQEAR